MEKQEVLTNITELSRQGLITKEEVLQALEYRESKIEESTLSRQIGITEILYYIGALIVTLGISILVSQNWSTLNFFAKILVTLGSSTAAYVVGVLLGKEKNFEHIGNAFHLIAAIIFPMGFYVLCNNVGFEMSNGVASLIGGVLTVLYLASFFMFRSTLFILFSIIFATGLFVSFTNLLIGDSSIFNSDFYLYQLLTIGVTYVILGYYFSRTTRAALKGFLYGFGIFFFLGAALVLGKWSPDQNVFWELIFPGLVFGTLFLSVYLKDKSFLTFGSLYLMAYVVKITGEYFSVGLGWPTALVFSGLMLIVIGYASFYLNKKYFK